MMELIEKSNKLHLTTADDYIQEIRSALNKGEFLPAREIAEEGIVEYPHRDELQKLYRAVALPVVKDAGPASNTSWASNREWLKAHWDEYKGKWVALRHGRLLEASPSLVELVKQVGRGEDIFFSRVG